MALQEIDARENVDIIPDIFVTREIIGGKFTSVIFTNTQNGLLKSPFFYCSTRNYQQGPDPISGPTPGGMVFTE